MSIVLKGNAKLMHLAQKVFRKSRRKHKYDGTDSFTAQTVEEVSTAITKKNDEGGADGFNNGAGTFFTTKFWGQWLVALDIVHLVRKVHEWDTTNNEFVDRDYSNEPANLHAEYDQLKQIKDCLIGEKEHSDSEHGDPEWMEKFAIWDDDAILTKYDASVEKAEAWMISKSSIFGN